MSGRVGAASWKLLGGVSAVAAGVLARKAASYYRRSTGHLPPGMEEVA